MTMPKWFRNGLLTLLMLALTTISAMVYAPWHFGPVFDRVLQKTIVSLSTRFNNAWLTDGQLHVWFCGTGSPQLEEGRAQTCVAILADEQFIILDTGAGSSLRANLGNLPLGHLDAVFLTHFHSDHVFDLASFANFSWRYGRQRTLPVFGPVGTSAIVQGFNQVLTSDAKIRAEVELLNLDAALMQGHEVVVKGDDDLSLVYTGKNGMRVYAFKVHHEPAEPAFGYRIEHRGRTVVFSGDTRETENMVRHGQNADIMIHEGYDKALVDRVIALQDTVARTPDTEYFFKMARKTGSYHTSPMAAAELAASANAQHLVLTHVIPPLGTGLKRIMMERHFLHGVDDVFAGKASVADDGTHLTLPLQ